MELNESIRLERKIESADSYFKIHYSQFTAHPLEVHEYDNRRTYSKDRNKYQSSRYNDSYEFYKTWDLNARIDVVVSGDIMKMTEAEAVSAIIYETYLNIHVHQIIFASEIKI